MLEFRGSSFSEVDPILPTKALQMDCDFSLTLQDVNFGYTGQGGCVLERVNLQIPCGEFFCIVGPSGCGKTTLLRLVGGLLQPASGTISIGNKNPKEILKSRGIAFVFQNPVLLPWRTVEQNVALPNEIVDSASPANGVADLLRIVGLIEAKDKYPGQLSGGMKSRTALARAFAIKPQLLLMDEPFGNVDEIVRRRLNQELVKLWRNLGCTVVFVTHSITEALFLGDRVAVMSRTSPSIGSVSDVEFPNKDDACYKDPRFHLLHEQILATMDIADSEKGRI